MKKIKFLVWCLIMIGFLNNTAYSTSFFIDIWGHWAEDTIMWATNDVSLFSGYTDGTFKPDDNITRAEFMVILYRSAIITGKLQENTNLEIIEPGVIRNVQNYKDVDNEFWAYTEIKAILNYISRFKRVPYVENIFLGESLNPNKSITREEAILLSSYFVGPEINESDNTFLDLKTDYPYYDAIKLIVNNDIIKGSQGFIFLEKNITRAESATLIQRLYKEMLVNTGNYLIEIELLENIYDNKFDYFGDYLSKKSFYRTKEDQKYSKAINTLEYLKIIKTIPYRERILYDMNPLVTLTELKKNNYWNEVGVNYYLLKYELYTSEKQKQLWIKEIIESYLNRDDLNYQQGKILADILLKEIQIEPEILLEFLNKWETFAFTEDQKANILFSKTRLLIKTKENIDIILQKYTEFENENSLNKIDTYRHFINNKVYVLNLDNKKDAAILYLNESWIEIKKNKLYLIQKDEIDNYFIGVIKQLKSK